MNPKIIRWTIYFLISVFLLWGIDKLIASYFMIKSNHSHNELLETISLQNQKFQSDSVFYSKIEILINNRQYNQAIELIDKRIIQFPDDKTYLQVSAGNIYNSKNDPDSAIVRYSESIKASDINLNAYVNRAYTYFGKNEIDKAIKDLKFAASYNWDFYMDLGMAQEKYGSIDEAIASYTQYLKHDSTNLECKFKVDSLSMLKKIGL